MLCWKLHWKLNTKWDSTLNPARSRSWGETALTFLQSCTKAGRECETTNGSSLYQVGEGKIGLPVGVGVCRPASLVTKVRNIKTTPAFPA